MRKNNIFLLVVILMALWGCNSAENTVVEAEKRFASVRVTQVKKSDITSFINVTGTLVPKQKVRLGPKVEGRIKEILADEGDMVKKGQPLIKLEQETYIFALNEAQTVLNSTKARLEKAETHLNRITIDYNRLKNLHEKGTIAKQEYDRIESEYLIAQAEVNLSKALIEEAGAKLSLARQNMTETVTYSPFDGFVVKKLMEVGENSNWVTYLWDVLHIEDISRVKIECPVSATKCPFIFVGKKASITVDAYPNFVFKGHITVVNPSVDPQSRTFIIKIEIPNPDLKLKPGMFARVKISEEERPDALQIPSRALLIRGVEHFVFLVDKDHAKACRVKLGISSEGWVEVVAGLKEGETVVIDGLYALSEGTKVRVLQ